MNFNIWRVVDGQATWEGSYANVETLYRASFALVGPEWFVHNVLRDEWFRVEYHWFNRYETVPVECPLT